MKLETRNHRLKNYKLTVFASPLKGETQTEKLQADSVCFSSQRENIDRQLYFGELQQNSLSSQMGNFTQHQAANIGIFTH